MEAVTLSNIGAVYHGLGEPQRALEYFGRALPIAREVGDRAGEVVTRYNVAMIHRARGSSAGRSPSWSRLSSWTARSATPTGSPTPRCCTAYARSWRARNRRARIAMRRVVRWVEVHRLAVAGREAGDRPGCGGPGWSVWLARSRFADVARLAELTRTLGEARSAFYQLGWARDATGDRAAALAAYGQGTAPVPGRLRTAATRPPR